MSRTVFGERLAHLAATAAGRPALFARDGVVTYGALAAEVGGLAARIAPALASPRAPVGIAIADESANLVASLALLVLGVPQVVLAPAEPATMRAELARRLGVRLALVDGDGAALPGLATLDVRVDEAPRVPASLDAREPDPDAPAIYLTSSGTTGRPKLIAYTHRGVVERGEVIADIEGFGPGDRLVVPSGMQGFTGRMTRLYALFAGASSLVHDGRADARGVLEACARVRATNLHLTVLQVQGLVLDADAHGRLGDDVRVFSSSTRLPAVLRAAFERVVGGRLYDRYGSTEVGIVSITCPRGDEGVPDSVGRPVRGAEVEIVDAAGRPQPPDTVGEIRARTPWMVDAYVDDDEATARHFRDGWFHLGDSGALTADGVLRFLGRVDDMMSLNGINVFPSEIERVLESHPAVRGSAAFPIASARLGQIPAAAVELRDDARAEPGELLAWARERLGVRAPRRIDVVDALPRSAVGKVLKGELARRGAARG
jgi:long-chain acyl-CoA synthetase